MLLAAEAPPRAEKHRAESESDRYRALLAALPDACLAYDGDGRIEEWGQQAEAMFGWHAAAVLGRTAAELGLPAVYGEPSANLPCCVRAVGRRGKSGWLEFRAIHADGHEFPVEIHTVACPAGDGRPRTLALIRDISQRVQAEDRLSQVAKMEAVGQMASGLAHDFKNILGIIVGSLEALAPGVAAPADQELLGLAMNAAQRALDVTQSLQAVARRRPLKTQTVDINSQIQEMTPLLRRPLPGNIELLVLAEADDTRAQVDVGGFANVLLNFVINARDAMPAGGTIMLYTQNVVVRAGEGLEAIELEPGDYIVVGVDDNGVGMPPAVLARAVEPFFTTKARDKGTGLGLAMAYAFARQVGGGLRIRSAPGQGTNLHLFIPRGCEAGDA